MVNKRTTTSPRPRHPARKRSRTRQQPGSPSRLEPPEWEESEMAVEEQEFELKAEPSRAQGETGEDEDLPDLDIEHPGAGTRRAPGS